MHVIHRLPAAALLLCLSQTAAAAPADPSSQDRDVDRPAAAELFPPKLLTSVSREGPEDAAISDPFAVDLELEISASGEVSAVRALGDPNAWTAAERALVEFAQQEAVKFRFEPAREGDIAVPVLIEYRYWVDPAPASPPAPSVAAVAPEPAPDVISSPDAPPPPSAPEGEAIFEATAQVEAPAREATRRTIEKYQLSRVPGTRGDPIRAVELQPGVSRSPSGQNPILRGSAQNESLAFLDGTQIPLLYHFGGLTSVLQARFLESVELYPGNFSARLGRATGGVIEAKLRDPASDGLHGALDVSLLDTSMMLEAPLNDSLSIAVGARRSNIDFVFEQTVPEDTFNVVAAPLYWDYQGVVNQRFGEDHRIRLAAFGSRDQIALLFDEPNDEDPTLRGNLEGALEFHQLQLLYEGRLDDVRQRASVSFGTQTFRQSAGPDVDAHLRVYDLAARAEWEFPVADRHAIVAGIDAIHQILQGAYRGSVASSQEGSLPVDSKNRGRLEVDELTIDRGMPALYIEGRLAPSDGWQVIPGIRLDYYTQLYALTINPRLSQRLSVGESTTLKAGIGGYSQPPEYYEALDPVGNPAVDPFHALHSSLGIEQQLGEALKVEVEGFYKWMFDRVVGTEGGVPPLFENGGTGRIYGLETSIAFAPRMGTFAQLSYTLSRSERRDLDRRWRLFDQDQPHVLSVVAGHSLGAGWEVGARFRYVSGNPNTPVTGALYDARSDVYAPTFAALNSGRDDGFRQIDVRGEKQFKVGSGVLAIYLDVQNVENRENPEGYGYSYDYSKKEVASGLPFFPNLGLRGEL